MSKITHIKNISYTICSSGVFFCQNSDATWTSIEISVQSYVVALELACVQLQRRQSAGTLYKIELFRR